MTLREKWRVGYIRAYLYARTIGLSRAQVGWVMAAVSRTLVAILTNDTTEDDDAVMDTDFLKGLVDGLAEQAPAY